MMRTTGAPRTMRLVGEMRAHMQEREMSWIPTHPAFETTTPPPVPA